MELLRQRILSEGKVIGNDILLVDKFINNQVDPVLMQEIGRDIAAHFQGQGITKVVTIESSGIAPALMTAAELQVPMVILKKHAAPVLSANLLQTEVTSYTTGKSYEMTLPSDVINSDDHVLIIDDFLADGEAVTGAMRLIRIAHATVAGVGILIEKSFQPGREKLLAQGVDLYSLVRIASLADGGIRFAE